MIEYMTTFAANNLGDKIRANRKERQLKVYELANKIGIHPAYLTQIEKNARVPSPGVLRKIEEALSAELKDTYIHLKFPADFLPKTKRPYAANVYDMIITVGDDATIGIDIKVKRSKTLNPELIAQKIEKALLTSFPNSAVKLASPLKIK